MGQITRYAWEHDAKHSFPLPFDLEGAEPEIWIAENGLKAVLGVMVQDTFAGDPRKEFDMWSPAEVRAWQNGHVYGICIWAYERQSIADDWDLVDRDNECWGYYGWKYAQEELKSQFEEAKK